MPKAAHTHTATASSATHLVLIPSYNTGQALLRQTVAAALRAWQPVWVVIDGSTDGSDDGLESLADELSDSPAYGADRDTYDLTPQTADMHAAAPQTADGDTTTPHTASSHAAEKFPPAQAVLRADVPLHIIRLPHNGGKGNAVYAGMQAAQAAGFTHALCFDADGQHPADAIAPMMAQSAANPAATVMGQPVFGSDAPAERLFGRKIANFFTEWEAGHCGLGDTLFGMRVYPLAPSLTVMEETRFARRFDFDPEIAVRLCWQGVQPLPYSVPCRYLSKEEGGVSHFNYLRDNIFQVFLHLRLLARYLTGKWLTMRSHKRRWRSKTGTIK